MTIKFKLTAEDFDTESRNRLDYANARYPMGMNWIPSGEIYLLDGRMTKAKETVGRIVEYPIIDADGELTGKWSSYLEHKAGGGAKEGVDVSITAVKESTLRGSVNNPGLKARFPNIIEPYLSKDKKPVDGLSIMEFGDLPQQARQILSKAGIDTVQQLAVIPEAVVFDYGPNGREWKMKARRYLKTLEKEKATA